MNFEFTGSGTKERIDKFLCEKMDGFTRSHIKRLIENGRVTVGGLAVPAKYVPQKGEAILVTVEEPTQIAVEPQDIPLDIIYEDSDIIVINKGKGMVVHPAPGNPDGTLVNALLFHCHDLSGINGELRPGIVHRIDKDTTGLLVAAKNDAAHLSLAKQIQSKIAGRIYTALVYGRMGEREQDGTVDAPIERHRTDRKRMAVCRGGGREAVTHYSVLKRYEQYTLIEARLETGRTHQIRVHMAYRGHPVVGDTVYCRRKPPFETHGQMLHAGKLILNHPATGEKMEFTAPLPEYFERILEKLPIRE